MDFVELGEIWRAAKIAVGLGDRYVTGTSAKPFGNEAIYVLEKVQVLGLLKRTRAEKGGMARHLPPHEEGRQDDGHDNGQMPRGAGVRPTSLHNAHRLCCRWQVVRRRRAGVYVQLKKAAERAVSLLAAAA